MSTGSAVGICFWLPWGVRRAWGPADQALPPTAMCVATWHQAEWRPQCNAMPTDEAYRGVDMVPSPQQWLLTQDLRGVASQPETSVPLLRRWRTLRSSCRAHQRLVRMQLASTALLSHASRCRYAHHKGIRAAIHRAVDREKSRTSSPPFLSLPESRPNLQNFAMKLYSMDSKNCIGARMVSVLVLCMAAFASLASALRSDGPLRLDRRQAPNQMSITYPTAQTGSFNMTTFTIPIPSATLTRWLLRTILFSTMVFPGRSFQREPFRSRSSLGTFTIYGSGWCWVCCRCRCSSCRWSRGTFRLSTCWARVSRSDAACPRTWTSSSPRSSVDSRSSTIRSWRTLTRLTP